MPMIDWNEYHTQLQKRIAEIGRTSPDIVRGYRAISNAGGNADLLGPKVRELIALAVAVTARCDGCIVVHTEAALKHGATQEEIVEALGVAITVNAGSALIYSGRVLDAMEAKSSAGRCTTSFTSIVRPASMRDICRAERDGPQRLIRMQPAVGYGRGRLIRQVPLVRRLPQPAAIDPPPVPQGRSGRRQEELGRCAERDL